MLCLLTGRSVEGLSKAPFKLDFPFGETLSAAELGLTSLNDIAVYPPPLSISIVVPIVP